MSVSSQLNNLYSLFVFKKCPKREQKKASVWREAVNQAASENVLLPFYIQHIF